MRLRIAASFVAFSIALVSTSLAQPVISSVQVDAVTEHTATISFTTDVPALGDIWIRPVGAPSTRIWHDNDGVYRTSHTIVVDSLYLEGTPNSKQYRPAAGLQYQYAAVATDAGALSSADSSGTFTTDDHPNDTFVDGWLGTDIGPFTIAGYRRFDNTDSTFYIYSSGTSLFNKKDSHGYVYKPISGNFELTAHLEGYAGMLFTHSKGAALFRASLDRDSEIYSQSFNYRNVDVLYYRPKPNKQHIEILRTELQQQDGGAVWVRMRREGNDFTVWYGYDGVNWTVHGPPTVNAPIPLDGFAGFAGLGHVDDYLGEVAFSELELVDLADTTPPVLSGVDATPINNTANIVYDANEWVRTTLEYGTTVAYGDSVVVDTLHFDGSIDLTGLLYNTEYHYRIRGYDTDSNEVVLGDMTFMTEPEGGLAVELAEFNGHIVDDQQVQLSWSILSSDGIARFDVQRHDGTAYQVVESVSPTGLAGDYAVRLNDLDFGDHTFRLRIVELDGSVTYSADVELRLEVPGGYVMSEIYPNPFESVANFTVSVQKTQPVTVEVYNLAGQRVEVLFDGTMEASSPARFSFDGSQLAGGVYFCRVRGENFVATEKMVLVK